MQDCERRKLLLRFAFLSRKLGGLLFFVFVLNLTTATAT
jgi:hypothetical protein